MATTYTDHDKDPITYLTTYCEINDIDQKDALITVGKKIAENPERTLHTFSKY